MDYVYCPECGKKLQEKRVGDEGIVPYCTSCEKPFFKPFPTCVLVVVVNERGQVILLRQKYVSESHPVLIAGYIKFGQTAEETVIQEVLEETGQVVESLKYINSYFYDKRGMLMLGYLVWVKEREITDSIEVDSASWYALEDALLAVRKGSTAEYHLIASKNILENIG